MNATTTATLTKPTTSTPSDEDPGERGSLSVADRVVERVAGHAVTLVENATAAPRRILGMSLGEARPEEDADVTAHVEGSTATVTATIAVRWPASVRRVTEETRRRIREEVQRITDVRVDAVDIEIVSMTVPTADRPRVR